MNKNLPLICPSCSNNLKVKSLYCDNCSTSIEGLFDLPVLASLSNIDQRFVIQFVKSSGSLKDMAKIMSLSYPTVRNMLDDLIDRIKKIENGKLV